jgi:hypothetical protein
MFTDPVSDQQKRRVGQLNISGKGGNEKSFPFFLSLSGPNSFSIISSSDHTAKSTYTAGNHLRNLDDI